jgi:GNAT superfamily N-acetyltransferase
MEPQAILALFDDEMRIHAPTIRARQIEQPGLTFFIGEPPAMRSGWVIYTHLDEANVDETIRDVISLVQHEADDFEWKTYDHDTPANLRERLLAHGFEPEEPEALVALDLDDAPDFLWQPVTADVRRITAPEGIDAVMSVEQEVWGDPPGQLAEELKRELRETPQLLSMYLAYGDGQPASVGWTRFYEGRQFADLWGGSTLPQYRGRGLYTALVAARAQEARARGVRFLTVDASPMSRPILEKHGFRFLTYTQPFIWKPPEPSPQSE